MRKLLYITLGFCGACGAWAYGQSTTVRLVFLAGTVLLGALSGKGKRPLLRAALVVLGCVLGVSWFSAFDSVYLADARTLDGQTCFFEIRVSDFSEEGDYGTVAEGMLMQAGKPYRVRVYLSEETALTPGDYLCATFLFRYTGPAGERESPYHQGKAVFLLAYQESSVTAVDYPPTRRDLPARIRNKAKQILEAAFPEDTASFARALLLGDTSGLSYETDTDLKISGIRHVVAVSGLHISMVFALLGAVTFHRKWLLALTGFPVLALFAAVAGFTPSVSRACIMCGLMLLAMLCSREYDGPTALAFAVLVILAVNPLAITSVSFQLSAASVSGIFLFAEGIQKWIKCRFGDLKSCRIRGIFVTWMASSVSVSLSAMVFTTPLCAYYFGMVSLIGPVTNLLTLWLISFIFYGILGICALYLAIPAAAVALAKCLSVLIRYILLIAQILADVPLAAVYTASVYIVAWLVFVYGMLLFFLISGNRKPKILACCALLGLCTALLAGWTENLLPQMQFTVLDVGQGQCLLFQTEGRTFLVDCGGDSDASAADIAAGELLSRGINRLDGMILTHLDRDHAGGAVNLLTRIPTDLLILPAVHTELTFETEGRTLYCTQPMELRVGGTNIQIYPPTFPGNSNEMSLCILFDTEKCDILVTGDRSGFGERALLRYADIPDVDILVAGHHGSKHSTCQELLAAVTPEIVCISAGQNNSYGHPAPELLQRLQAFGCSIYRTDQHGTITIRR